MWPAEDCPRLARVEREGGGLNACSRIMGGVSPSIGESITLGADAAVEEERIPNALAVVAKNRAGFGAGDRSSIASMRSAPKDYIPHRQLQLVHSQKGRCKSILPRMCERCSLPCRCLQDGLL